METGEGKLARAVRKLRASPPDHLLVAYETDEGGGKPVMDHQVYSYFAFFSMLYNRDRLPLWHESIHPDRPCKLFLDIDRKGLSIEKGEIELLAIKQEIAARLEKRLGITPAPEPLILDASTPIKYSVHLIYPIWFETPRHICEFLHEMPFDIDRQPYPINDTPTFMRFAFSKKVGKENYLIPRWRPDVGIVFDLEVFCQSTITLWSESDAYKRLLPRPEHIYSLELDVYKSVGAGSGSWGRGNYVTQGPAHDAANRILNYIQRMISCDSSKIKFKYLKVKENGSWECVATPPLFCHLKGMQHKSNNTYIGSSDSKHVWYRCPDANCRVTIFLPIDFTEVVSPNALPSAELLDQAAQLAFPDLVNEEEDDEDVDRKRLRG